MGGDDEKENLIGDFNTALESQWECSVGSIFWEEFFFFQEKRNVMKAEGSS